MKKFFGDFGKKLGETVETVTNKTGEAVEIQKIKMQIRTLEKESVKDFETIGRTVYEKFNTTGLQNEPIAAICEGIRTREKSIEEYKQKITSIKGDVSCPGCGKEVTADVEFCPFCGEKIPEDVKEAAGDGTDYSQALKEKASEAGKKVEDTVEKAEEITGDVLEKTGQVAESAWKKATDFFSGNKE